MKHECAVVMTGLTPPQSTGFSLWIGSPRLGVGIALEEGIVRVTGRDTMMRDYKLDFRLESQEVNKNPVVVLDRSGGPLERR